MKNIGNKQAILARESKEKGSINYRIGDYEDGLVDISIQADGLITFYACMNNKKMSNVPKCLNELQKEIKFLIQEVSSKFE